MPIGAAPATCGPIDAPYLQLPGAVNMGNPHVVFFVPDLDSIDVDAMALNPAKSSDIEIISPCGSERCYVLTLSELLEFKELLAGARVMLQLNSILHERLYRIAV